MNLQITCDNFNLSDSNRQLIDDKITVRLDKLLSTFPEDIRLASIRISQDKFANFLINFDMTLPPKTRIFAQTNHKIFESALIDLTQEIEKQLNKYREDLTGYSLG